MRNKSGFTLIELMIVLAIGGILAALAMPSFRIALANHRLKTGVRETFALIQLARINAIKEHTNVVVRFDETAESYMVFVDNGAGGGTADNRVQDGAEEIIKSGTMPKGITIDDASFAGGATWVRFDYKGMPNGTGGHVYMSTPPNLPGRSFMGISVNITGMPKVVQSLDGGTTWGS